MFNLVDFPAQSKCCEIFLNPISQSLPFPLKFPQTLYRLPANRMTRPGFCSLRWKSGTRVSSYSSNNQSGGGNHPIEIESSDGADDFKEDEDDEDNVDEVFVPLRKMKEWHQNKPRGFGEGEVYDTLIEDKLVQEIEQSRRAQLANINKLKNNPINPSSNTKNLHQEEASKDIQGGFRVRLVNLPKKRNIHRDLQLAFKGFPGIVNIVPVVSGNNKTRDPICKGIAFIDFMSEDGAQRFVQTFSGKSICFGKVEKHVKCEMMSPSSTNPKNAQFEDDFDIKAHHIVDLRDEDNDDEDEFSATFSETEEHDSVTEGVGSNLSFSAIHQKKIEVNEKKKTKKKDARKKESSSSTINIPGSARMLKIREKAQLTGVLSKYGLNTAASQKQQAD